MMGQYSIRNGLSLVIVPGNPNNTLSARAFTMGEMFKGVGYATAIFGKWHLGSDPQSLPTRRRHSKATTSGSKWECNFESQPRASSAPSTISNREPHGRKSDYSR